MRERRGGRQTEGERLRSDASMSQLRRSAVAPDQLKNRQVEAGAVPGDRPVNRRAWSMGPLRVLPG